MTQVCYHYKVSINLRMKAILRMSLYGVISYLRNHNEHLHEVKPVMNRFNKTE